MLTTLFFLLSVSAYLYLNACKGVHIVNKIYYHYCNTNHIVSDAIKAKEASKQANQAIKEMTVKNIDKEWQIPALQSIMPKIRDDTYKLCVYALAMKLALEQPNLHTKIATKKPLLIIQTPFTQNNCVPIYNIIDLAASIIDYTTVLFDTSDLTNYIDCIMRRIDPTIQKNYSRQIAGFLQKGSDPAADKINLPDGMYRRSINHILQSIIQSAQATIDKIDTAYFEIDDVFMNEDHFIFLRKNALISANNAHDQFKNARHTIMFLKPYSLQKLSKALIYTIKARNAMEAAHKAYRHFDRYFYQFTPIIQAMLYNCDALCKKSIQKMVKHCDKSMYIGDPTIDDDEIALGIDIQALQEIVDTINEAILKCRKDLQEASNRLDKAILESHKAARLYKICRDGYNDFLKKW